MVSSSAGTGNWGEDKMKLVVGMYVRTNNGIGTIHRISGDKIYSVKLNKGHIKKYVNILKEPSFNILDLIEEGDLLEIQYLSRKYVERVTDLFKVIHSDEKYKIFSSSPRNFRIKNNEFSGRDQMVDPIIKRIITKEQLDSVAYRI